jgi:hypothetical protein
MKKILIGALAAATAAGALVAAAPASARDWNHDGWHHDNSGAAVAAGIAGLAVGAALASGDHGYYAPAPGYYSGYSGYYYGSPPPAYYAGPSYGYGYYGGCHTGWRWDPYWRRYVRVRACY